MCISLGHIYREVELKEEIQFETAGDSKAIVAKKTNKIEIIESIVTKRARVHRENEIVPEAEIGDRGEKEDGANQKVGVVERGGVEGEEIEVEVGGEAERGEEKKVGGGVERDGGEKKTATGDDKIAGGRT